MRIGEFCKIRMGYTFRNRMPVSSDGAVRLVQPANITADGRLGFSEDEPLRVEMKSPPKPLNFGDVLVLNRGTFAAAVFDRDGDFPWIAPSSLLVLTVHDGSALPKYVALYLNSTNGQRLFQRYQETTTVPFVSLKNLGQMDIPVPPLDRQRELVAFDDANRKYRQLTEKQFKLRRSILAYELSHAKG